ncbi:hypothetical protein Tco_0349756 [Tanacetum coccineum]
MKNEGTAQVNEGTAEVNESTAEKIKVPLLFVKVPLVLSDILERTACFIRYRVLNAHIRYHLKELRYCAQCLIIENEDFVKRSRDHYMEPTEFEIQEMFIFLLLKVIFRIMLHGGYFEYWKAGLVVVLIMCGGMIISQGEALKIVSFMEIVL